MLKVWSAYLSALSMTPLSKVHMLFDDGVTRLAVQPVQCHLLLLPVYDHGHLEENNLEADAEYFFRRSIVDYKSI